jgi:Domain of unknown function (DUF1905)
MKGFVKVEAKVGNSVWNTSLFPHKEPSFNYIMSIKKKVREKENLFEGDMINIDFKVL